MKQHTDIASNGTSRRLEYSKPLETGGQAELDQKYALTSGGLVTYSILYLLDHMPRLLFILSRDFVQQLLESGDYTRLATISYSTAGHH